MSDDLHALTDEEIALLAAADSEPTDEKPTDKPAEKKPTDEKPTEKAETQGEEKPKPRAPKKPADKDDQKSDEKADAGPEPGHPMAPPAQMTYENDPWGGLPKQMRHDLDGNPVL